MRVRFAVLLLGAALFGMPAALSAAPAVKIVRAEKNGGEIWIAPTEFPPVVTLRLLFSGAGYATDEPAASGRAALAARLLTEGAGSRDAEAFHVALEDAAIKLAIDVQEETLSVELQTLRENIPEAVRLLTELLTSPRFDASAVSREKKRLASERDQQSTQPGWVAGRGLRDLLFGMHPYGYEPRGTVKTVDALTRHDLQNYMQRFVTRENLHMAIVGPVDEAEIQTVFAPLLKTLPARAATENTLREAEFPRDAGEKRVTLPVPQTRISFALPGVKRDDPDFFAAFILNHILGGGNSTTRLMDRLREQEGLVYGVNSQMDFLPHAASIRGSLATRNRDVPRAIAVLKQELKRLKDEGVTARELEEAKRYLTGSFPLEMDEQRSLARFISSMQLYGLGADYLEKRNAMLEAVTLEQVNKTAARLIDLDRLQLSMAGGEGEAVKESPARPPAAK